MKGVIVYHTVKTLSLNDMSQRKIAEHLDVSKTTINKYVNLSDEEALEKLVKVKRPSQFDVALNFILMKLDKFPNIRSSKLYRKVIEEYPSITARQRAFRHYVRRLRKNLPSSQQRFYHPVIDHIPGHQIQVDPGQKYVKRDDETGFTVYFVAFVSSYSRKVFAHFQTTPYNTNDFINAHLQAFQYYGGIVSEYVYDQTKLVVIKEHYREVWLNEKFHQFALQSGFEVRVCEGYDPESKGKVERVVQEVKEDFLYGEYFTNIEDVRNKSIAWFEHVGNRVHSTTNEKPYVRFLAELVKMKTWSSITDEERKVDKVGLISYCGNKYSVPFKYQQRTVLIKESLNMLIVMELSTRKVIAKHPISQEKNQIIKNNNHYRDFTQDLNDLISEAKTTLLKYNDGNRLVDKLVNDNPKIPRDQVRGLLKLHKNNQELDWNIIIFNSLQLLQIRASRVEAIVAEIKRISLLEEIKKKSKDNNDNKIITSAIQRALEAYMVVLNG
jgi:transposase